eukprot:363076-Chlamydomonas_euryale.AAC.7
MALGLPVARIRPEQICMPWPGPLSWCLPACPPACLTDEVLSVYCQPFGRRVANTPELAGHCQSGCSHRKRQ